MSESLYRLMTWLSPSFPVGAYAFSHGLETAVETGRVRDAQSTREWIEDLVRYGNGRSDLVFLAEAFDAAGDLPALQDISDYCRAFQGTAELRLESVAQGRAFIDVSAETWPSPAIRAAKAAIEEMPYPVAVGLVAAEHGIEKEQAMHAFVHAFVANLVSAAVRLVPLGQTDGQRITAALESAAQEAVAAALTLDRHSVSNVTILSDIVSMQHETQYTRLFRS